jgi:hypothetical protein
MTTEVKSSEEVERIYIGGLDPDRLPAQQIVERLKQTEGIYVESSDYKPTDTYMFINAVAKNKKKDEEEGLDLSSKNNHKRPLEIITAMYNNVRWKGCRLKVEAAKPHFLQILANEIQQRSNKQQQQQQLSMHSEGSNTSNSNKIPRNLRIRRRRGDEVTKIDTKPQTIRIPCHELMTHSKNNIIPKRKKFSRAVHIIFLDNDDSALSTPKAIDNTSYTAVHEDSENTPSPIYGDNDDVTIASQTSTDTTSINSDEKSPKQQQKQTCGSGRYQWSDDSDSSSSDISNKSYHDEPNHNQDDHGNNIVDEEEINLSNDVSINMNIFAQLFPDAAEFKQQQKIEYQKKEKEDPHLEKHFKDTVIPRYDPTSASAKTFEIQKDNKTEEVATFSMKQEEKGDSKSQLLNDNDTLTIEKANSSTIQPHSIYQEKNLETVFQENSLKAKNGQGFRLFDDESLNAEKPVGFAAFESNQQANIYQEKKLETIFQEPALKSKNRQGFHLFGKDESSLSNEEKPAGFCFAFTPDEKSNKSIVDSSLVPATSSMTEVLSNSVDDDEPAAEEVQTMSNTNNNKRRWHGFCFPQNILNDWEDEFFALNGGLEIDDDDNDEWEEKRVALTLDWRRKYKHAMERLSSKRRKRS